MTVSSMLSVVFIWFTIQRVLGYGKNATNAVRLLRRTRTTPANQSQHTGVCRA